MLDVKPVRQTPSHCGPACLKMVFDYYGKEVSEKEIAKAAKTTIKEGTSIENMARAAKHFGFNAEHKENSSVKEMHKLVIRKKIPVIANLFAEDEGHYTVIVGIDKDNIYMIDPEEGYRKKYSLEVFKRIWFGFKKTHLTSCNDLRIRPIIVVTKK